MTLSFGMIRYQLQPECKSRKMVLNLWVVTFTGVKNQILCLSDIYTTVHNSKIIVMRYQ